MKTLHKITRIVESRKVLSFENSHSEAQIATTV